MSTMNTSPEIESKIDLLQAAIGNQALKDRADQICLHCRSVFGLLIQSLAWASSPNETAGLFDSIPRLIELMESGSSALDECKDHPKATEYKDSVNEKSKRLESLLESGSLQAFLELEEAV